MATEKRLVGETGGDLARDGDVGKEHELQNSEKDVSETMEQRLGEDVPLR